jgi:hypothetical protein
MKRKMISACLTAVLLLALSGQCFAAGIPFADLGSIGAKDKILSLQERGYVSGVADGVFAPDRSVTAAQGVRFIVKALDLNLDTIRFIKAPKATDYFTKADDSAWYADTLIIAAVNGLDLPKDMDPNQKWTREEFTYQLVQAMEKHENLPMIKLVPVTISDQDQMNVSYSGAIQRALAYDIVKLDSKGNFDPKAGISSAEAAEQIYNALAYLAAHPMPVID